MLMKWKILILGLVIFYVVTVILTGTYSYREGFESGSARCTQRISEILNREKQEVLHEILGKYQGQYNDDNDYDYNRINELFKQK